MIIGIHDAVPAAGTFRGEVTVSAFVLDRVEFKFVEPSVDVGANVLPVFYISVWFLFTLFQFVGRDDPGPEAFDKV